MCSVVKSWGGSGWLHALLGPTVFLQHFWKHIANLCQDIKRFQKLFDSSVALLGICPKDKREKLKDLYKE